MSTFRANYDGIGQMLRSPEMQAEMLRRAGKVHEVAVNTAPVYEQGPHPGRYREAFHIESGVRPGGNSRAFGRVINDSDEAFWAEYGSVNNEAHHTLARALDAARD